MNSLCQTELDVCKGKLITERADKKRLSGMTASCHIYQYIHTHAHTHSFTHSLLTNTHTASMDRLDDKAIDMGKNLRYSVYLLY